SGGGAGPIANGSRGWLVSSVTGRERECGREIVNVLDEWCDKLDAGKVQGAGEGEARTGEGTSAGKVKGGSSIDALLANEVASLKKQPRFVSVESGCKALLFVRIREEARKGGKGEKGRKQLEEGEEKEGEKEEVGTKEEGEKEKGEGDKEGKEGDKGGEQEKEQEEGAGGGGEKEPEKEERGGEGEKGEAGGEHGRVSPCELAEAVLRHAKATQQSATRFTLRLLPVETTCYASQEEIASAIKPLIAAHFPPIGQSASDTSEAQPKGSTFGIIFEKRANEGLERAGVIDTVAKLVPAPHKVDLRNPDKTIMLQVVKV
ncbi:unnamed protein product, partial [Closterium sp. Yama58-4]